MIDALDLVTLFIAIFHTVRRLDVAKRSPADYPNAPLARFQEWQTAALRALGTVRGVCFTYIAVDLGIKITGLLVAPPLLTWTVATILRAAVVVLLAIGLLVGFLQVRAAGKLRMALEGGSDLGGLENAGASGVEEANPGQAAECAVEAPAAEEDQGTAHRSPK